MYFSISVFQGYLRAVSFILLFCISFLIHSQYFVFQYFCVSRLFMLYCTVFFQYFSILVYQDYLWAVSGWAEGGHQSFNSQAADAAKYFCCVFSKVYFPIFALQMYLPKFAFQIVLKLIFQKRATNPSTLRQQTLLNTVAVYFQNCISQSFMDKVYLKFHLYLLWSIFKCFFFKAVFQFFLSKENCAEVKFSNVYSFKKKIILKIVFVKRGPTIAQPSSSRHC